MIIDRIRNEITPGMEIPKPCSENPCTVKGWGIRRGSAALVYKMKNHNTPEKSHEKKITEQELICAYNELKTSGEFTRPWFNSNKNMQACKNGGGCNFTTIGGIFILLDIAYFSEVGTYTYQETNRRSE